MKENKYDDENFFTKYSQMERSGKGLKGAGEWHVLRNMLPDFHGKSVLDLGCGFGWHCQYAAGNGARYVLGIDISQRMLEKAVQLNQYAFVEYKCIAIEDYEFPPDSFDIVISSLAFHYLKSFEEICKKISICLSGKGYFIFSAEHPVFTAQGKQDWIYDKEGNRLYWPVDRYFEVGERNTLFLGEQVIKYHRTLTEYISILLDNGFEITGFSEPQPDKNMLKNTPEMIDELRRPMFFIISTRKK